MREPTWRVDEIDDADSSLRGEPAELVSLHFLRTSLRRRWRLWVGLALLGIGVGLCFSVVVPAQHTATTTLLLAHAPGADPAMEMATDVSLLRTRTVATAVIDDLGLDMSPEDFHASVTVDPETSTVLVLTVAAPDTEEALRRTRALAAAFLRFRTEKMDFQTDARVEGWLARVEALEKQSATLTAQYDALSAGGASSQAQAAEVLTQRSQATSQVGEIRQAVEETRLANKSIVGASHVLDQASEVPHSSRRRLVLTTGSGLVVGTALGLGLVLFLALVSDRLRRREEVALALETPVRHSVGRMPALRRWPGPFFGRGGRDQAQRVLVHGLLSTVTGEHSGPSRLAVGGVQNSVQTRLLVARLGVELGMRGQSVFLVDLSEKGDLAGTVTRLWARSPADDDARCPVVYRPATVPSLALGPFGTTRIARRGVPDDGPTRDAWQAADVVVTLADVDPAIGVDHLKSWSDRVVLIVSAGRSSAERLRTTAQLIRAADLRLLFAMMIGADHHDESLGLAGVLESAPATPRKTPR
jgi:capsular polysaccharide biosynthesis protein